MGLLIPLEGVASLALALGGVGTYGAHRQKCARSGIFIISFIAFVAFSVTGTWRAMTLWGSSPGQCKYFGDENDGTSGDYIQACPTTRHENTKPVGSENYWEINHQEPLYESDCIFWFWDNTPSYQSLMAQTNPKKEQLKLEMLENMNWADKKNYGLQPIDLPCNENTNLAAFCLPDGRTAYNLIEKQAAQPDPNKYGVTIVKQLDDKIPEISFCYYWGCSKVCNEYRYRVNRVLLYGTFGFAGMSLLFLILCGSYAAGVPIGYPGESTTEDIAKKLLDDEIEAIEKQPLMRKNKWKPMNVDTNPTRKRLIGDSRTLRF